MNALQHFLLRTRPQLLLWLEQRAQITWRAFVKYIETDGEQRAASFAYYAFFAMFPLILLFIAVGTAFLNDQETASNAIISYISAFIPLEAEDAAVITHTINGVVKSRNSAGLISLGMLLWSASRFFQALVGGVNRAWGAKDYSWWRLPLKNLLMTVILASALFLGIGAPTILKQVETYYWNHSWQYGLNFNWAWYLFEFAKLTTPIIVLFYGMCMFYKFAPLHRRPLSDIWGAALFVTLFLEIVQRLFNSYATNIGHFNAIYGTLGSVVSLLLWIYLSGSLIIFGGCLSAAKYEIEMSLADQSESTSAPE